MAFLASKVVPAVHAVLAPKTVSFNPGGRASAPTPAPNTIALRGVVGPNGVAAKMVAAPIQWTAALGGSMLQSLGGVPKLGGGGSAPPAPSQGGSAIVPWQPPSGPAGGPMVGLGGGGMPPSSYSDYAGGGYGVQSSGGGSDGITGGTSAAPATTPLLSKTVVTLPNNQPITAGQALVGGGVIAAGLVALRMLL